MLVPMFIVEILIMAGFPVGLWLRLRRWSGITWGLIGAGAVTFVLSQVVHVPLNWALGLLGGGRGVALWPLPLLALVAGLSAGVCEEVARYLILRFWRREARTWDQGVAFGAGHGGVEAILLGVLVAVSLVAMISLREMGLAGLGLSGEMQEQLQIQALAFWAMPWYLPLLGGLERVLTIIMHVAWSLLVVRALTRRNGGWLVAAVGTHALVDGVAVFLSVTGWPLWALEGIMALFALGGLALILALRRAETGAGTDSQLAGEVIGVAGDDYRDPIAEEG